MIKYLIISYEEGEHINRLNNYEANLIFEIKNNGKDIICVKNRTWNASEKDSLKFFKEHLLEPSQIKEERIREIARESGLRKLTKLEKEALEIKSERKKDEERDDRS